MDFTSPAAWAFWLLTAVVAYIGSYASEKGKRRAAKEDSEQLRHELARNTHAVKEIEAKVNSDVWDRQWRLNQKRDAYARVIEGLSELEFTVGAQYGLRDSGFVADQELLSALEDRMKVLMLELERSRAVAKIYVSAEAVKAIEEFEVMAKRCDGMESLQVFRKAIEALTQAAKVELRV